MRSGSHAWWCVSSSVGSDDIPDGGPAERTLPSCSPLLDSTLEAHAHVATGVEHTVHIFFTADHALRVDQGGLELSQGGAFG